MLACVSVSMQSGTHHSRKWSLSGIFATFHLCQILRNQDLSALH